MSSKVFFKLLWVAPVITGIIIHFMFHIHCISPYINSGILVSFLFLLPAISARRYCQMYHYYYYYYFFFLIYSCLLVITWRLLLSPDLNERSKRFTTAHYEWCVQRSLVWSSVALWPTADLGATEGSDLIHSLYYYYCCCHCHHHHHHRHPCYHFYAGYLQLLTWNKLCF